MKKSLVSFVGAGLIALNFGCGGNGGMDTTINSENTSLVKEYAIINSGESTIVELDGRKYEFSLKSSDYESAIVEITNYSK